MPASPLAFAKTVRNEVAEVVGRAVAAMVFRLPAAEGAFLRIGRLAARFPLINAFFRRSKDGLGERWRASDRHFRTIDIEGVDIVFDCTDFTVSGRFFYGRCYEPETTRFIRRSLSPGNVFVDIGANKGYYVVLAARLVGKTGRVYAFEPGPDALRCLLDHVRRNGVEDRVHVNSQALSSSSGTASLFISNRVQNSGLSSLTPSSFALETGRLSQDNRIPVATETYDAWSEREAVGKVDVLLMDVEGGEGHVLEGMARTLEREPPAVIICETSPDSAAHRTLLASGYDPRTLEVRPGLVGNILYTHRTAGERATSSPASGRRAPAAPSRPPE